MAVKLAPCSESTLTDRDRTTILDPKSKIIVFAQIDDENSRQAYKSNTDAYRVFKQMPESVNLPDNWDDLLKNAKGDTNRLEKAVQAEI